MHCMRKRINITEKLICGLFDDLKVTREEQYFRSKVNGNNSGIQIDITFTLKKIPENTQREWFELKFTLMSQFSLNNFVFLFFQKQPKFDMVYYNKRKNYIEMGFQSVYSLKLGIYVRQQNNTRVDS